MIGAPGLLNALYDVGVTMNDVDPDYVIVGETASYNYEVITKAVRLVLNGARLIATNSDLTGPTEFGIAPASRSLVAPIELATGRKAYFYGQAEPAHDAHGPASAGCPLPKRPPWSATGWTPTSSRAWNPALPPSSSSPAARAAPT